MMSDVSTIHSGHINGTVHVECLKAPSPAQALVQLAAYRIDLNPSHLSRIVQKMDDEVVTELWQLKFLDSINWQGLGAPIGLVAAIRACLQEKEIAGSKILHAPSTATGAAAASALATSSAERFSEIANDINGYIRSPLTSGFQQKRRSTGMLPEFGEPIFVSTSRSASRESLGGKDLPPQSAHRRGSGAGSQTSNPRNLPVPAAAAALDCSSRHTLPPPQPERRKTLKVEGSGAPVIDESEADSFAEVEATFLDLLEEQKKHPYSSSAGTSMQRRILRQKDGEEGGESETATTDDNTTSESKEDMVRSKFPTEASTRWSAFQKSSISIRHRRSA